MTDSTATFAANSPDMTTVLRSIHSDETQLRTLVVILSLTGGLVLAFALGFGIYLYWHCCARPQGREHWAEKDVYSQSISSGDDACSITDSTISHPEDKYYGTIEATTMIAAGSCRNGVVPATTTSSSSSAIHRDEDGEDEELLNAAGALAPSAPTAKEILIADNERQQRQQQQQQQQQTWCHYHMLIEPPPPAYTPPFRHF